MEKKSRSSVNTAKTKSTNKQNQDDFNYEFYPTERLLMIQFFLNKWLKDT